jgi:hypothetical protein
MGPCPTLIRRRYTERRDLHPGRDVICLRRYRLTMTFRAQFYHYDNQGNRSLVDYPHDVHATTHKAAAELVCGKGLVGFGPLSNLAVRVWTKGVEPPDMAHFFRPEAP